MLHGVAAGVLLGFQVDGRTVILAAVLLVYLIGLLGLSIYAAGRVKNEEDYLVAGRRLPLSLAWATLMATWFGAATMLGAADEARQAGLRGVILDPFASGAALIIAGLFFAAPLWNMRLLTISDFYGRRFGRTAELAASLINVPGYCGWIAAQFVALAELQAAFFKIDRPLGMVIAAGITLTYTMMGGMWSVTLTDALQIGVALLTLLVLAWTTLAHLGDGVAADGLLRLWTDVPDGFLTLAPEPGVAAFALWCGVWASGALGNIPGQDLMQRVFASKSARTAAAACLLAGVFYIGFGLAPVGLGMAARILHPDLLEEQALAVLAREYLSTPLAITFVVSVVSIIISTCTSAVLSPAAILGHNILGRIPWVRGHHLLTDRLSVLAITAVSLAVAFTGHTIMELLELSLSVVLVALFVPLVGGLYGPPRSRGAALWAMGLGFFVWLARESLELAVLVQSAASLAADEHYADFVAATLSAARLTDVVGWGPLAALLAALIYGFALLPSALSGVIVSGLGYWLGGRPLAAWPDAAAPGENSSPMGDSPPAR